MTKASCFDKQESLLIVNLFYLKPFSCLFLLAFLFYFASSIVFDCR